MRKTFIPKVEDVERDRKCYIVDANGKILGRVASKVASVLRGKHKRTYTPNMDCGDTVIVINADKIKVTGKKLENKEYQRYTGYPGGQRIVPLGVLLERKPETVLRLAVDRMIPHGALGNKVQRKLKIYAGDKHPHLAQKPIPLEV